MNQYTILFARLAGMLIRQIMELFDILDAPSASGERVKALFLDHGAQDVNVRRVQGEKGHTDCILITIQGHRGKSRGGNIPTLGIIGRLGGLGARPDMTGFVSDGDGALAVLACALKLVEMKRNGDGLAGDVMISTHVCPNAPTLDHFPVPFMDSPINMDQMNDAEVNEQMDMIISVDTTKGNEIVNHTGIAISPTVKEGYILPVSNDLLQVYKRVTGHLPVILPLSIQDITPYANTLPHINSILQPSTVTKAPVVGLAITSQTAIAGCATGASHVPSVEQAARFSVEVAKDIGKGICHFYSEENFMSLHERYGSLSRFQTSGDSHD
jgi:hypothetical protein